MAEKKTKKTTKVVKKAAKTAKKVLKKPVKKVAKKTVKKVTKKPAKTTKPVKAVKAVKKTAKKTKVAKPVAVVNPTKKFVLAAAKLAKELHCTDVVALDLRGISPATDYFLIATGTSSRQMQTVADEISQLARADGLERFGKAGYQQGRWILLDFFDVVIHLFDSEYRDYYNMDMLWGDAKKLRI
ncbi:MAG: ribosome silencing factor [Planctomycetes bacterium]|nr:ribosome silencing factor [Planctomycetota bacterium]